MQTIQEAKDAVPIAIYDVNDIALAQAVESICGMAMDMCRMYKGYKTSIEIL